MDARFTVYDDEREVKITFVSTYVVSKGNQIKIYEGHMKHSNHQDIILKV